MNSQPAVAKNDLTVGKYYQEFNSDGTDGEKLGKLTEKQCTGSVDPKSLQNCGTGINLKFNFVLYNGLSTQFKEYTPDTGGRRKTRRNKNKKRKTKKLRRKSYRRR